MSPDVALKTADPAMIRLLQLAANVATSRATILITGERGTGKEALASYIHAKSPRAARRLVIVNCLGVPEEHLDRELFSTGAKFDQAKGGTLVLNEIGEMSLALQAKLFWALQNGEAQVRIIATATRDLVSAVRGGAFREDLYYRLNVISLNLPSLRERPRDIEILAHYFSEVSALVNDRPNRRLSPCAVSKLRTWAWPGNLSELENVIERAVLVNNEPEITAVAIEIADLPTAQAPKPAGDLVPGMTIGEAEQKLIMKTLEYTKQNRTKAAQLLGISIRTLRNKLHEYGVAPSVIGEEIRKNG